MSSEKQRSTVWFWLVVASLVFFVTLLSYSQTFNEFLEATTGWSKNVIGSNPVAGALVFFLFSMISAMLAFVSTAVLVPAANLVWGRLVTFLLLWGGWISGGMLAFIIGRLARPLLIRVGYKQRLEKYREYVSRRTNFWMVLLFCFAVPSEIPGYVLGGVHYPFGKFLAAIAITECVYGVALVFAGDRLLAAQRLHLFLILGTLTLIAAGARLLFRKLRKKSRVAE